MNHLKEAQDKYKQCVRRAQSSGVNLPHNDSILVSSESINNDDLQQSLSQFVTSAASSRNNSLHVINPLKPPGEVDSVSMYSQKSDFSVGAETVCTTISDSISTQTISPVGSPPAEGSVMRGEDSIPGAGNSPSTSQPVLTDNTNTNSTGDGEVELECGGSNGIVGEETKEEDMTVTSAQHAHMSPPRSPYNSARSQRWKLKAIHERSISMDTVYIEPTDVWGMGKFDAWCLFWAGILKSEHNLIVTTIHYYKFRPCCTNLKNKNYF